MLLTDLAVAARKSGLIVVELDGWKSNVSGGDFNPRGVLCHHTGSYDGLADAPNDLAYARWLAFTGRSDLPAPLCNLALSAEGVVYVCSSGNANHAGRAKATGPMPAASDGNALYIGIEAMNSGSQGWDTRGTDNGGNPVTQGDAYVRLCAALCAHYGWPASHVRAHRETSVTGKWDPGLLDMDPFRDNIADLMQEDPMPTAKEIADAVWSHDLRRAADPDRTMRAGKMLAQTHERARDVRRLVNDLAAAEPEILGKRDVRIAVERGLRKVLEAHDTDPPQETPSP